MLALSALVAPDADLSRPPAPTAGERSPIGPGFWAWSVEIDPSPEAIAALCADGVTVRFTDGSYFSLLNSPATAAQGRPPTFVIEAGQCRFDPDTQIETCDLVYFGGGRGAASQSMTRFSHSASGSLVASSVAVTDEGVPAYTLYPVACPSDAVLGDLQRVMLGAKGPVPQ